MISEHRRDYYAGALMVVIGLSVAYIASHYKIGTLTQMGPGFVPTSLGVILAILGVSIALVHARAVGRGEIEIGGGAHHGIVGSADRPDWRGWICIIGGMAAFIVFAEFVGLLPAVFSCVFIAAWGDRTTTLKGSLALAVGISVFGILLFSYVLGVSIPVLRGFGP